MPILKCKMCGGDIQPTDQTYGTCDSCGSTMTLPKASDERKANLFNRANHYRRQNDFDKAVQAYESILNEDSADAEAHWGIVLSKYGIEYVEDPQTHKPVPTCHRVQSDSILNDIDYLEALRHSPDDYTRSLYEEEAYKISEIQKTILAISNREEPYDVFICYKETTDGGSRTKDSVLAQEIYHRLEKEGYRVFFAKITLESKLGLHYESYIFNALQSAKVMLVIGTKPEHINSVWVKNEWSRFLKLIKNDSSRLLIPCYRDMDAYDLPEEMSMFQAQDMSKIGFIEDLVHGINKVCQKSKASVSKPLSGGIGSLTKRGYMALEESNWKKAFECFDKALDIDPEYAPAYIGKLCVELKLNNEEALSNTLQDIEQMPNFRKAIQFANDDYLECLNRYKEENKRYIEQENQRNIGTWQRKSRDQYFDKLEAEYEAEKKERERKAQEIEQRKVAEREQEEERIAEQRRQEQAQIEADRIEREKIEAERPIQEAKQRKVAIICAVVITVIITTLVIYFINSG